ncbi:hypothetical protein J2T13_003167 [Paenibacillus sp. DS2015]
MVKRGQISQQYTDEFKILVVKFQAKLKQRAPIEYRHALKE